MSTRRPVHAVPLVAGLIVVIVTVMLGNWQLRRAAEKTELQMQIDAGARSMPVALETNDEPAEWRIVALRGEWLPAGTIYLDNRVHGGRAGYHVLTPLQLEDGSRPVLVNRGWVAMGANRLTRPSIETPAGPVQLEGTVRWPERKPFTLAAQAGQGELWQYIDLEDFREWSGAPVRDWIVQQSSASADALVREWPRPDTGIDQHRGYAFQWYGLAGVASVMAGVYVFRSRRTHAA